MKKGNGQSRLARSSKRGGIERGAIALLIKPTTTGERVEKGEGLEGKSEGLGEEKRREL
jgi:hypothetical protein